MTDRDWLARYLALLEVEASSPDLKLLQRLTHRHLSRVPFENVTSMLRRRTQVSGSVPGLDREALLAAWTERRGGGLCFEVTEMFGGLLRGLGYQAWPILARISFPGSHQALVVHLDGERYLVDVGNGAPFFEPIPLHGSFEVHHAGLGYRFRTEGDRCVQDRWVNATWEPLAYYDLWPAAPAECEQAYQQHHVLGESWVVDSLRLIRCRPERVDVLGPGQLTCYTADGKQVQPVEHEAEYVRAAAEVFDLPRLPIAAVLGCA